MKQHPILNVIAVSIVLMVAASSCNTGGTPAEPQSPCCSLMQSVAIQDTAEVGDATLSEYNNAEIIFMALDDDGVGVGTLAPAGHTGDGSAILALPAGWTLQTPQVVPGGCGLALTHIYNPGNGRYTVSVVTNSTNGVCPWLAGDYVYYLIVGAGGFQGATLGKITIQ